MHTVTRYVIVVMLLYNFDLWLFLWLLFSMVWNFPCYLFTLLSIFTWYFNKQIVLSVDRQCIDFPCEAVSSRSAADIVDTYFALTEPLAPG